MAATFLWKGAGTFAHLHRDRVRRAQGLYNFVGFQAPFNADASCRWKISFSWEKIKAETSVNSSDVQSKRRMAMMMITILEGHSCEQTINFFLTPLLSLSPPPPPSSLSILSQALRQPILLTKIGLQILFFT